MNFYPTGRAIEQIGVVSPGHLNFYEDRNRPASTCQNISNNAADKSKIAAEYLFPNLKYNLNGKEFVVTTLEVSTLDTFFFQNLRAIPITQYEFWYTVINET